MKLDKTPDAVRTRRAESAPPLRDSEVTTTVEASQGVEPHEPATGHAPGKKTRAALEAAFGPTAAPNGLAAELAQLNVSSVRAAGD